MKVTIERGGRTMKAATGDRLVVKGHTISEPDRDAEILEVHGTDGTPPYLVRWSDDGHVGLVFPGADAVVEQFADPPRTRGTRRPRNRATVVR